MLRLLAACALFSIALHLSAQVMEEEPNDFITQAMDIGLNETVIASFSSAFEYDFYRVTLPEQGKINVDITNFDLEPHDLAIVNIAGNAPQYGGLVEALNNADPQTHIEKCCLAAGDYYIRVQGPFNANNDQYYVEMTFIPHDGPNDDAPHRTNETAHDATEISLEDEFILAGNIGFDQHLDGESRDRDDWFKVNMPSRGGIVLEEISSEAEYDATCASWNLSEPGVDVYLNEGNLGNGSGVPTDADLASCLSVEYFLIAVKDGGFSGINEYCQSYALPGELVLFPNEDDADNDTDDDIIENANEITLGEQDVFDGYIGYVRFEGIVVRDLKDFWKFEMPTNGPMQAIISFDEDFVDLQFFARDSNGNPLALGVSTSYFENEVQLDFECIEEGQEIYLEVKHSGGNCGPYQMTFNYGSAPTTPEGEFDSFEDAGTLNVGSTTQVGLGLETLNEENQVVSDDQDFYQLEIPSGRLRLNFTGIDEFPTTELYLQDLENDGDGPLSEPILIESDVIDEEENDIEWYCLGAGTYFVKFTTAGPFECGAFSVNPQMIDSAADADTEPEDPENPPSITTAVDGTLGYISYFITNDQGTTFASGDEKDTWLYQSTGPGDFFISLVSDDIESLEFKIYNSEGEDLTEAGSPAINGNTMEWLMTCLDSGEFRIEIDLAAGALCTAYTLSVEHGYEGDDESQDNDSIESAQQIEVDETYDISLGFRDPLDPFGLETSDDTDWYRFDWEFGQMDIEVTAEAELFPQLTLYASVDGEPSPIPYEFEESTNDGVSSRMYTAICLGEGTYFIELSSININGFECERFDLKVLPPSEIEYNDQTDGIEEIAPGETQLGSLNYLSPNDLEAVENEDVYRCVTEDFTSLSVSFTPEGELTASISFYADEELSTFIVPNEILAGDLTTTYNFGCFNEEDVYMVVAANIFSCTTYSLTVNGEGGEGFSNDQENNNAVGQATVIPTYTSFEGQLGTQVVENIYGFTVDDTEDWYEFTVEDNCDSIKVTLNVPEEGDLDDVLVGLYRNTDDGALLLSGVEYVNLGSTGSYTLKCAEAGNYFLQLYLNQSADCSGYSFIVEEYAYFGPDTHLADDDFPIAIQPDMLIEDHLGSTFENTGFNGDDRFAIQIPPTVYANLDVQSEEPLVVRVYKVNPMQENNPQELFFEFFFPGGDITYELQCLEAGDHVIQFFSMSFDCFSYNFNVRPKEFIDTAEPNNTIEQATPLNIPTSLVGTVGVTVSEGNNDFDDFYTLTLPANQTMTIQADILPEDFLLGSIELQLIMNGVVAELQLVEEPETIHLGPFEVEKHVLMIVTPTDWCQEYTLDITSEGSAPGDLNGDGVVNTEDLTNFFSNFPCTSDCSVGDLNGDGLVNIQDLIIFLSNYGG